MVLSATKTSLFKLVQKNINIQLPKMKDTSFVKTEGNNSWWLEFTNNRSEFVSVYFGCCVKSPFLRIKVQKKGEVQEDHIIQVDTGLLKSLNMVI